MIRIRALICSLAAVGLAASAVAHAQPATKVPRIGWLFPATSEGAADLVAGFRNGLRMAGYAEGKILSIDFRFADGRAERLPAMAMELTGLPVDVIVTVGSGATAAAKKASATIPIVMVSVGDPVGTGFVSSLARPGGNITGVSADHTDTAAKWLQLLMEVAPKASRIGYLEDLSPNTPITQTFLSRLTAASQTLGVVVEPFSVPKPEEVEPQLAAMARARVQAILVGPTQVPRTRLREIVAFAAKNRLPALYGGRDYVDAGGLMSYNPSRPGMMLLRADEVIQ